MWIWNHSLLEIVLRTTIVFLVVFIGLRLVGKREAGQMSPFDLVLLLLIANAVQNAMTGPDTSATGGIVAAITLLVLNTLFDSILYKRNRLRKWLEGTPTILAHNGKIIETNLRKERITMTELEQSLREHGVIRVADVYLAVLEIDGTISILKNDEKPAANEPHNQVAVLFKDAGA